jgi:hydroxypyruvate isomerase
MMRRPVISLEMTYEDELFLDRIGRVADYGFDAVEFTTWFDKDLDGLKRALTRTTFRSPRWPRSRKLGCHRTSSER